MIGTTRGAVGGFNNEDPYIEKPLESQVWLGYRKSSLSQEL